MLHHLTWAFVVKLVGVAAWRCCCTSVDDGPTITHGGMPSGAAVVAASKYGAGAVVDPRPFFVGELAATLSKYPHIGLVVPAMGYSEQQVLMRE